MIIQTSNGGQTWREQSSGVDNHLFSVFFLDNEIGWAVGENGTVVLTENGGKSWESVQLNSGFFISDIKFRDKSDGWAVGSSRRTFPSDLVLHSTDGGRNWTRVDVGVPEDLGNPDPTYWDDVSADFNAVATDGDDQITIVGFAYQGGLLGGIIVQSNDGGKTWQVELTNGEYSDVAYINENGNSTRKLFGRGELPFTESETTENPVVLKSTIPNSMDFADSRNGCAVGYAGWIFLTNDGGETWSDIHNGFRSSIQDIQFFDSLNGWAATFAGILRTQDGGKTWTNAGSSATSQVYFVNEVIGFAGSFDGNLDKTSDGGTTWTRVFDRIESRVYDMHFYDSLIGWTCGIPYIMHTRDGGRTWTQQWLERDGTQLWGISFVDSLHGWVVGHNGRVLRTNDGGKNWTRQTVPMAHYHDVFFIDSLTGWAAGASTHLIYTTDGGNNWGIANVPEPLFGINSIEFIDNLNGWAVGSGGRIIYSIDGGKNWNLQESPADFDLYTLCAVDSNNLWAGGWFGTLIRNNTSGH
jgi:photosystem II stability/assembly factor-like uncharacterized protein